MLSFLGSLSQRPLGLGDSGCEGWRLRRSRGDPPRARDWRDCDPRSTGPGGCRKRDSNS